MRLFDWFSKRVERSASEVAAAELNQFLARLKGIEEQHRGMVARQVAHIAFQHHRNGICLHEPQEALRATPRLLWTLEEEIIQLQKGGRQAEAPGRMVWAHTLRAVNIPEIHGLATEMWSYIERGFDYALDSRLSFEET